MPGPGASVVTTCIFYSHIVILMADLRVYFRHRLYDMYIRAMFRVRSNAGGQQALSTARQQTEN